AVDAMYGRRKALSLSEIKRDYRRKPGHFESPLIERMTLHALAIEFPDPSDASIGESNGARSAATNETQRDATNGARSDAANGARSEATNGARTGAANGARSDAANGARNGGTNGAHGGATNRAHRHRIRVESPIPRDLARVLKQLAKVRAW